MPPRGSTAVATSRPGGVLASVGAVATEMPISDAGTGCPVACPIVPDSPHGFAAVLTIVPLTLMFDTLARWLGYRSAAGQPQARDRWKRTVCGAPDNTAAMS